MFQLSIELSDDLREFIEERRKAHKLDTVDDFIEFLLRMEILRLNHEKVEELILEGIEGGPGREWTKDDWTNLKNRLEARWSGEKVETP
jgi:hypothetical protein